MPRRALDAQIKTLYHYDEFRPDYFADLLRNRRFHCANPSNLNDPWDCRPWFKPEIVNDPIIARQFIEWVFSNLPPRPLTPEQEAATRVRLLVDAEYRTGIVNEFSRRFLEMIPGRWGIYCLTPHPDSILMWSHYANDHKGICLEYSTDNGTFGGAREVEYLSSYPDWTPQSIMHDGMPHVLLTKSEAWKYEDEFRVIGMAESIERPIKEHPLIMREGFLGIPDGALRGVIIGCEADAAEIEEVVRGCDSMLPIKLAVRAPTEFKLEIVEG